MKIEKVYEFLKDCYPFYVCTIKDGRPNSRPFGAIMCNGEYLYVATGKSKKCYQEMINDAFIQIIAQKPNSRKWIRVDGIANEEFSILLKEKIMQVNPILLDKYNGVNDNNFALIKISVSSFEFN